MAAKMHYALNLTDMTLVVATTRRQAEEFRATMSRGIILDGRREDVLDAIDFLKIATRPAPVGS